MSALPSDKIEDITALDTSAFGTNRGTLLALLSENASIFTLRRGGEIVGYSMCREFGRGHVVGPIVAKNDHDAIHHTAVHLNNLKGRFARVDTREKDGDLRSFFSRAASAYSRQLRPCPGGADP